MNAQRLINMAIRMLMRHGSRWISTSASQKNAPDQNADRRAFRQKQPGGDAQKRMRALKRFTKF